MVKVGQKIGFTGSHVRGIEGEVQFVPLDKVDHGAGVTEKEGVAAHWTGCGHIFDGDGDLLVADLLLKVFDLVEPAPEFSIHGQPGWGMKVDQFDILINC